MSRSKGIPVLFGCVSLVATLLVTLVLAGGYIGGNEAEATPPPPPNYTLTVTKSGGDSTCEVRIGSPSTSAWTSGSVSQTFVAGTDIDVDFRVNCPSGYVFDHWESNNDDLDGQGNHGGHGGDFTIIENTTATAVFVPRILPDAESTIWHDHHTQNPHLGDMYWHQVSSSSNPTYNFAGITINEDFLISEMDASSCSMTLTQQQKEGFQNS